MTTSTPPAWDDPPVPRPSGKLGSDLGCDVCVVGAGIAGLTAAYLLARAGKSVVVLDAADPVAVGESAHTTAHLSSVIDDRFGRLIAIRGEDAARLAHQSHAAAIDRIEALAAAEGIACDFARVDGFLFPGRDAKPDDLTSEAAAARRAGVTVEVLQSPPVPGFGGGPCLRFPDQGQFHPLKYLAGLAKAVDRLGGQICTGVRVTNVEGGSPCRVTTNTGKTVLAAAVVVATNTPVNCGAVLNSKMHPYSTYAISLEVTAGAVPVGLFWDTEDPYHYVRLASPDPFADNLLIVGGEDHKTGQADDQAERWGRLEAWARERFPGLGAVRHRWSGMVFETLDGLALIGKDPSGAANVYLATGDSGMGMTHGTIAGVLLSDLILGRDNPWVELYAPDRWPVVAVKTYVEENVNLAAQYADWVTSGETASAEDVAPGTGAVVRRGVTKVAVYREPSGCVHEVSAVCPHLGGIVRWNPGEQTWDCPCHGSRFAPDGRVIHGPAADDLAPVRPPAGRA